MRTSGSGEDVNVNVNVVAFVHSFVLIIRSFLCIAKN